MIKKVLTILMLSLICMSVDAQTVTTKDLIGSWKLIVEKGVKMAADIEMYITPTHAAQVMYYGNGTTIRVFNGEYYLTDTLEVSWSDEKVGKSESGTYLVRCHKDNLVQSKLSLDKDGNLVVSPVNNKNGMVERFKKIQSSRDIKSILSQCESETELMMDVTSALERERLVAGFINYKPGALSSQFASLKDKKQATVLKVAGPLNSYDINYIKYLDSNEDVLPYLKTIDLSRAWFVTDSIMHYDYERGGDINHERFLQVPGYHMTKNCKTDTIGGVVYLNRDGYINTCYHEYGWILEMEKDKSYVALSTTNDGFIREHTFSRLKKVENIILPMSTTHICNSAFVECPNLKEVQIPASVKIIDDHAFLNNKSLSSIKIAKGASIYKLSDSQQPILKNKNAVYPENTNLKTEIYSYDVPDVTFTIRGKTFPNIQEIDISDYTNHKGIKKVTANDNLFSAEITVPKYSIICFNNQMQHAIIAEGGDVYIDLTNDSISGTPLNDKLNNYQKILNKDYSQLLKDIRLLENETEEQAVIDLKKEKDLLYMNFIQKIHKFVVSNKYNVISTYIISRFYNEIPERIILSLLNMPSDRIICSPLLRNQWEWIIESLREHYFDFEMLHDTSLMTKIDDVKPGELKMKFNEDEWCKIRRLKISGKLNDNDIDWLRELSKGNRGEIKKLPGLIALDLSDVTLVDDKGNNSTYLPESAFHGYLYLKYIVLPKSIETIGERSLSNTTFQKIVMYDNVKVIEEDAFMNSSNLREMQLSKNLEKIGRVAFWGCNGLRNIVLPDKVKEIGFRAFNYCRNLEHLHSPASTENIDKYICNGLSNTEISIDDDNKFYKVVSNVIFKRDAQKK